MHVLKLLHTLILICCLCLLEVLEKGKRDNTFVLLFGKEKGSWTGGVLRWPRRREHDDGDASFLVLASLLCFMMNAMLLKTLLLSVSLSSSLGLFINDDIMILRLLLLFLSCF